MSVDCGAAKNIRQFRLGLTASNIWHLHPQGSLNDSNYIMKAVMWDSLNVPGWGLNSWQSKKALNSLSLKTLRQEVTANHRAVFPSCSVHILDGFYLNCLKCVENLKNVFLSCDNFMFCWNFHFFVFFFAVFVKLRLLLSKVASLFKTSFFFSFAFARLHLNTLTFTIHILTDIVDWSCCNQRTLQSTGLHYLDLQDKGKNKKLFNINFNTISPWFTVEWAFSLPDFTEIKPNYFYNIVALQYF